MDISHNKITVKSVPSIVKFIQASVELTKLNLSYNNIGDGDGDDGLEKIIKNLGNLEIFNISGTNISVKSINVLAHKIGENWPIKELYIAKNKINGKNMAKLFNTLFINKTLEKIDISYNYLNDSMPAICKFLNQMASLKYLNITNCFCDEELVNLFLTLKHNKTLSTLKIGRIGFYALEAIVACLETNNIITKIAFSVNEEECEFANDSDEYDNIENEMDKMAKQIRTKIKQNKK